MFTWNFQYVSKARLTDNLSQLALNIQKGDVLIRIHTAVHQREEAVELARFVKNIVPKAHVFGTSTSAVINWGKMDLNQCVISVTQMDDSRTCHTLLPTVDDETKRAILPSQLCENVKNALPLDDVKLMLAFTTGKYVDVSLFVDQCNTKFPGVRMIGGVANYSKIHAQKGLQSGFVFDENGWYEDGLLVAAFGGKSLECLTSFVSGVQTVGEEMTVTQAEGNRILTIDGKNAKETYLTGGSNENLILPDQAELFPFAYSEDGNLPLQVSVVDNALHVNHVVSVGKKIKRAFIYDRQVIEENRMAFRSMEKFEKAETLFGYSDAKRLELYPNSAKWELSAYENTNLCGCITDGEIINVNGRNAFSNCAFAVSVVGEKEYTQEFNPYAFSHADALATDNEKLIRFLMGLERKLEAEGKRNDEGCLKSLLRECEQKILYSKGEDIPNEAALHMDVKLKGIDRICVINVLDVPSMTLVFSEQMIQLTYKNFVAKCMAFAKRKKYRFYELEKWRVAIGVPSYMVSLADFTNDMESLYRELFESAEEYIAIVPLFCVMYNCTMENLRSTYNSARMEMMNKNVQFFVTDASEEHMDEESIRRKYQIVNVINYAISHDTVVPYYQGIYDNRKQAIRHYEALMRLVDENGDVYLPKDFLGVARSFGLMYDSLSLVMIKKVFERFKDEENKAVSINIGIRDVKNPRILEFIYDSLSTMKHPENFIFEFLENEDVEDYNVLVTFVDKIHDLGGKISIDDFGSGYANLQHILSIHSDYVKIDGSIIRNCCIDKESENLIALITGWKNLSERNVKIVAEFVENEEIQRKMMIYNIDYSQGYLFSKPSPEL